MTANADSALSLVIPARNSAGHLLGSLASLEPLAQGGAEVLLVDDGSSDESAAVFEKWATRFPAARLIVQPALGLPSARNRGIQEASREFVQFLDSDDIANPLGSRFLIGLASQENAPIVRGAEARHRYGTPVQFPQRVSSIREVDSAKELLHGFGGTLRFIYRRDLLQEYHLSYPEHLAFAEDLPFALMLADVVPSYQDVGIPLYSYALGRPGQLTDTPVGPNWDRLQPSLEYCLDISAAMRKDVRESAAALLSWYALSAFRETGSGTALRRRRGLAFAMETLRRLRVTPAALLRGYGRILRSRRTDLAS